MPITCIAVEVSTKCNSCWFQKFIILKNQLLSIVQLEVSIMVGFNHYFIFT